MKSRIAAPILAAVVSASLSASAESSSTLSSARELAKQGLQAYDAGNYQEAAEKLANAYRVVHVPTLAVNQARALVELGRWVAASELYLEAMHIPKEKSWQSTQSDAQRDAAKEREKLLPRIPRLRIAIVGAKIGEVEASIDGTVVPVALLDAEQLVDPGTRRIRGTRGEEVATESLAMKEGERATVTLHFAAKRDSGVPAVAAPNQPQTAKTAVTAPHLRPETSPSTNSGAPQRTLGWIGLGVGGAGLIAGTVAGLMAISKRSKLEGSGACSPDARHCDGGEVGGTVDTYNAFRTVSTIGWYTGGVLAVAGVTLLLTSPKRESEKPVGLWIGPSGAALTGGF